MGKTGYINSKIFQAIIDSTLQIDTGRKGLAVQEKREDGALRLTSVLLAQ